MSGGSSVTRCRNKVVQRAKMILYVAAGQNNVEIARRLETAPEVVGRWRTRFFEQRLAGLEDRERAGRPRRFPPAAGRLGESDRLRAAGRARPAALASPAELHRLVVERSVYATSASTIARWLAEDAIKPWRYRSWIFPSDPEFAEKAGRVLDLYEGRWEGKLLHPGDCEIRARLEVDRQLGRLPGGDVLRRELRPGPAGRDNGEVVQREQPGASERVSPGAPRPPLPARVLAPAGKSRAVRGLLNGADLRRERGTDGAVGVVEHRQAVREAHDGEGQVEELLHAPARLLGIVHELRWDE